MDEHNNFLEQEENLYRALKSYGHIFPETDEELILFEKTISQMKFIVPEKFQDPQVLLNKGKVEKISNFHSFYDHEIEENLAQAAREGGEISEDILRQMEKDREEAEEDNEE